MLSFQTLVFGPAGRTTVTSPVAMVSTPGPDIVEKIPTTLLCMTVLSIVMGMIQILRTVTRGAAIVSNGQVYRYNISVGEA